MRTLFEETKSQATVTARPYQVDCVDAIFREVGRGARSTLAVLATGLGKTVMFGFAADRWLGRKESSRVLILAHTEELVVQPQRELEPILGFVPDVEMAGSRASKYSRCVLASVQSLSRPSRLSEWPADHFDLVIWDEAHHKVKKNKMYWSIRERFGDAFHLGVTATPRRRDKIRMGEVFESVCYEMPISTAVEEGWLVDVEQQFVHASNLDLSGIETGANGDLVREQLSKALTQDGKLSWEIAAAVLKLCGEEKTIIFTCPRPAGETAGQGEQITEALNSLRPGSACFLDGETPKDDRRRQLARYKAGEFNYLVGCNLFLEGFNEPAIRNVVMARSTTSSALYEQCIGRGTRTLPGTLTQDMYEDAPMRLNAIARSAKPSVRVLDFVGNSGKHKLVSAVDIFAGVDSPVIGDNVVTEIRNGGRPVSVRESVRKERVEEAKREAARMRAKIETTSTRVDPFRYSDGADRAKGKREKLSQNSPATPKQRKKIHELGGRPREHLSIGDAGKIIDDLVNRRRSGVCSERQEDQLRRNGLAEGPVPRTHAKAMLDWIAARGWSRPSFRLTRKHLAVTPKDGGFRLKILDPQHGEIVVGPVFRSPDELRSAYAGMVE